VFDRVAQEHHRGEREDNSAEYSCAFDPDPFLLVDAAGELRQRRRFAREHRWSRRDSRLDGRRLDWWRRGGGRLGRWQFFLRRRGNRWFRCRCFFGLRLGGLRRRCGHTAGLQFRYLFFEDVNPRKQRCPRRLQFHVEMRSERTATFSSVLGIAQAHEQRNT